LLVFGQGYVMPHEYRIDPEKEIVFSHGRGCLTDEDLIDHQNRLRADPLFKPHFRQLADFRAVTRVEVKSDTIRRIARANPFGRGARRAAVVDTALKYGFVRMFEILTDEDLHEIRICADMAEARTWLGLDPEPARDS
jgi:hypothetical protein